MEKQYLTLQCRGSEGTLEKDVGVVIIPDAIHNVDEGEYHAKVCCVYHKSMREDNDQRIPDLGNCKYWKVGRKCPFDSI
jgi:hypothetical protein